MQSNGSSMSKMAVYAVVFTMAFLRISFAGLMYIAALDSKTIYISYALVVISSIVLVFAIRKLFTIMVILHRLSSGNE